MTKRERNAEKSKRWREANPERAREISRKFEAANREKRRAKCRRTYNANPEYHRKRVRDYRVQHAVERRAAVAKWKKAHPVECASLERKRNALKKSNAAHTLTRAEWQAIRAEYAGRCAYCGHALKLTQEHIQPLSAGGAHSADNVVPACEHCNKSKFTNSLIVWLARGGLRAA